MTLWLMIVLVCIFSALGYGATLYYAFRNSEPRKNKVKATIILALTAVIFAGAVYGMPFHTRESRETAAYRLAKVTTGDQEIYLTKMEDGSCTFYYSDESGKIVQGCTSDCDEDQKFETTVVEIATDSAAIPMVNIEKRCNHDDFHWFGISLGSSTSPKVAEYRFVIPKNIAH